MFIEYIIVGRWDMILKVKIKEKREQAELTQRELAKKINMDTGQLSRIETGQVSPTVETLYKIALAIGCGIEELHKLEEE